MKRAHRLRRPQQFQRVRREGRTIYHPLLQLNVAANRHTHTRCGFVVTRRLGTAVQRNRARRRIREAVRLVFDHIVVGMDLVFVVRSAEVTTVPFPTLQATVEQLLRRANLWCDLAPQTGDEHASSPH